MRQNHRLPRLSTRVLPWVPALLCSTTFLLFLNSTAVAQLASGRSEVVLALVSGNHPEGIAVHQTGEVFIGNQQVGETATANQILKVLPDGTAVVFATLPSSSPDAQGLLGLTIDPVGNLYAALASFDGNHGIWRVSRDGTRLDLLPGSSGIVFPNALTFDRQGNLYVTDSFGAAIWRSRRGEPFGRWIEDPLLGPLPTDPFGIPLPGANGIAFYPPDTLYVANTERSLIAKVQISKDGSAGAIDAVTSPFAVPTVDGIAVDVHGQIHAVLPGFSIVESSPLVRIDPETGTVTPTVTNPIDSSRFDTPLSLAFGAGRWGVRTVLVTNGDLPEVPGGPGPGVVQVDVGVPGFPIR